jgi:FkbM family methyltransferase
MRSMIRTIIAKIIPFAVRKRMPRNITKHLYFKGDFPVFHNNRKLLRICSTGYVLENEIYFYGLNNGHERKAMSVWIEYCQIFKPKVIYDIGANTGIYGLVSLALDADSKVSFFEPLESATRILRKNLELNNFNADVFELALSNYDGEGVFFMNEGRDFLYSITLNEYADQAIQGLHDGTLSYEEKSVKVVTIDTLIKDNAISKPNLVKLDVETHEPAVLSGFGFDLSAVDAFLIEVLNLEAAEKLNQLFSNLDFYYFNLDDELSDFTKTEKFTYTGLTNYFVIKSHLASELKSLKLPN